MGKLLIKFGLLLALLGFIVYLFENTSFRIPGDMMIKKPNFTLIIPIGTCILLSLVLTVLLNLLLRFKK
ncbi:MAG TPA: DUF2905 family protein [Candidatus Hydrothermia bacterium]|nr:DUF2905 domain-containing protein [Candidatus Hydrothermae bacterium]MDD3648753.1 DUF2905 family protein [Candidatus Hydrothermia bacterium]MDD5573094.1 DUF2905 family protein [Candidatus Hydrothermia bacterium]HOK23258.1 DUF2905 family protein [Candidatus Hydrothermia bacterium]HOL24067.1 DUF2905 family protein [Candidatus Hydrothermia bacterium]